MREKATSKATRNKEGKKMTSKDEANKTKEKNKCYNCGEPNHKSADYKNKTKG